MGKMVDGFLKWIMDLTSFSFPVDPFVLYYVFKKVTYIFGYLISKTGTFLGFGF